jgi:hypothetical protein
MCLLKKLWTIENQPCEGVSISVTNVIMLFLCYGHSFCLLSSFNILHSIGFVILTSLVLPLQGKLDRKNMMNCLGHPISCLGIEFSSSLDCSSTLQVAIYDNLAFKEPEDDI